MCSVSIIKLKSSLPVYFVFAWDNKNFSFPYKVISFKAEKRATFKIFYILMLLY